MKRKKVKAAPGQEFEPGAPTLKEKEKKRNDTELSKNLWELKKKNEEFTVSWKILAKARAYSNLSNRFYFMYRREILYYTESPNGDAEQAQRTGFNLQTP